MILNGTIYLKKELIINCNPKIIVQDKEGLRSPTEQEQNLVNNILSNFLQPKEVYDEDFWLVFATNEKIFMYNPNKEIYEQYDNLEEINKRFITLEQFLKESYYVGRNLMQPAGTEWVKNGKSTFFTKDIAEYIILFRLGKRLIVRNLETGEYKIVSSTNQAFKKYYLEEKINPEFCDKNGIYQDIIAQIYHKGKKDNQGLERK